MSSTQPRHARHHYGTRPAALVLAALLAAFAVFILAAVFITSRHAGPVTGAPGPQMVLRPPAASQQITVTPGKGAMQGAMHRAAMHQKHLAHLAHRRHAERLHAAHVRHLDHLIHLGKISSE